MPTLSAYFKGVTIFAMTGWLALIFLPNHVYTEGYIVGVVAVLLAVVYGLLLIFGKKYDEGVLYEGSFKDLEGVVNLFKSPRGVLIGWIHYLAFDLVIGLLLLKNSQHYGISHWLMLPCLFFTFMFGPLGLLMYVLLRFFVTQGYFSASFF